VHIDCALTPSAGSKIEWEELWSESDKVGMNISTKALGSFKREDITHQYKYREGIRLLVEMMTDAIITISS